MKLFSKCPYTLDTCGTSLHTYSIWNTTAGIQPCRTQRSTHTHPTLGINGVPPTNQTQPRTPNPVASTIHMSRRHLKCHCLDPDRGKWFWMTFAHGEWRRKRTQGVHIVDLMKNPFFCPPYKKKKKVHSDTYTVNISIHQSDYRFIRMTFANIYCHRGYHTQTCKPCSHTTHIRKLLQVAVAIINAASMQKTTWVTSRVVSFQKQFHPIKWNKSEKKSNKTLQDIGISFDIYLFTCIIFNFQLWPQKSQRRPLQNMWHRRHAWIPNQWHIATVGIPARFVTSRQPRVDPNCTKPLKKTSSKVSSPSVNKPIKKTSTLNLDVTTLL